MEIPNQDIEELLLNVEKHREVIVFAKWFIFVFWSLLNV